MENRTKASIHTTEVLTIMSKNTNQEFRISISLPSSYDHKPDTSFPALYVVDGNILFEMVTGISRMMQQGRVIPEMVVVSIGYPLEGFYGDDFIQFFVRRGKDFTAVVDRQYEQTLANLLKIEQMEIGTGGAEDFLRFINEELTSLIETRYRINSADKTLLGHSTGGHFALYTLLKQPQIFQRYIVGSPSLGIGQGVLFNMEKEYATQHRELPVKLFLGIGEEEEHASFSRASYLDTIVSVSNYFRFSAIIEDRGYRDLKFSKKLFEGYGHTDVVGPIISMGLKNVFAKD